MDKFGATYGYFIGKDWHYDRCARAVGKIVGNDRSGVTLEFAAGNTVKVGHVEGNVAQWEIDSWNRMAKSI